MGYTVGPELLGQNFFIGPPDPGRPPALQQTAGRQAARMDFLRKNFLQFHRQSVTPVRATPSIPLLFQEVPHHGNNGIDNDPPGNYEINYQAILAWIATRPATATKTRSLASCRFRSTLQISAASPRTFRPRPTTHTTERNITNADQRFSEGVTSTTSSASIVTRTGTSSIRLLRRAASGRTSL